VFATPAGLARLLAVPRTEVEAAAMRLARRRVLTAAAEIAGRPGRFLVSV
jgi:hypothetical protein